VLRRQVRSFYVSNHTSVILEILQKYRRLLLFKVIETDMDQSATYDFLLAIHSIHGPISYRFGDKRRFMSKITNFPHSLCI